LQRGKADIRPVEVRDNVQQKEKWQKPPREFRDDSFLQPGGMVFFHARRNSIR
jgi:hypothetical protein